MKQLKTSTKIEQESLAATKDLEAMIDRIVRDERKLFLEILDQIIEFTQTVHANTVIAYAKACKEILKKEKCKK